MAANRDLLGLCGRGRMTAPTPRARVLDAVADLTDPEAVRLLRDLADRLEQGLPVYDSPPPRLLAVAGCPSEYAYLRHVAAGETCTACNAHMADLVGRRRAQHPEWVQGA